MITGGVAETVSRLHVEALVVAGVTATVPMITGDVAETVCCLCVEALVVSPAWTPSSHERSLVRCYDDQSPRS